MAWFQKMCRDMGLMIHNVARPDHRKREVRRKVEEHTEGKLTLRRTTIEEIEVKQEHRNGA